MIRRRWNHYAWIGPLLCFAGAVSYFTFFARFPALRDFPWVNLPLVLLGLALAALGARRAFTAEATTARKILGAAGLGLALLVAGLFCFYVFFFSYGLPGTSATTLALDTAPDFTLPDQQGTTVQLAGLRGKKVVLTFYRGFW